MIRIDYYFTFWLVIWFLLYYFKIIKINPKLIIKYAFIVNALIICAMIYNKIPLINIISAFVVIILTKFIPYYLIKDKEINDKDIYYSLMVFILYLFYVQIMSGNLISKFNEIYYENLILGKKTPIPLFILSKIIEIRKRKKTKD